ncbi:hypothetical protein ACFOQM_05960 [Paenibacillus sp. GCM10012307]|uniref:Runt domain-containing protein n=1 Tax=Paenibacillus roseus TaxID=2798579 RepID=A0A934IX00_9BACL|nr:hypothetical protein [Paenibacillus roseus]MBJ6360842.1 hypothetical protein [Paenibacillus roseus]
MSQRENGYSPVKTFFMTPDQLTEYNKSVKAKVDGPQITKWKRTMTREQYLAARLVDTSHDDIMLSYFNNDPLELRKQLLEWGLDKKTEKKELEQMAQAKVELTITKGEYLQRRLNGEKRSGILRSLGVSPPKFYELLDKWGIREMDAEGRALELMAPTAPAPEAQEPVPVPSEVEQRLAEQLEHKAEARGLLALNAQNNAAQQEAGAEILQRMQERAAVAAQARENSELHAEVQKWKGVAEDWKETVAQVSNTNMELEQQIETQRQELHDRNSKIADLQAAADRVTVLEAERDMLMQTIELAAIQETGMISFNIPIQSATVANAERTRIYTAIEALDTDMEAVDIDRGRVMRELFDLLQSVVNFVTADLEELHPGQAAESFIHQFFAFHNERHLDTLAVQQEVV